MKWTSFFQLLIFLAVIVFGGVIAAGVWIRGTASPDFKIDYDNTGGAGANTTITFEGGSTDTDATITRNVSTDTFDFSEPIGSLETKGGPTFDIMGYGATGDGVANDTTALTSAEGAADDNGGIVYLPPGEYKIEDDVTISSNVTMLFDEGAKITIDSGKTVTWSDQAGLDAGAYQIFDGDGTAVLGSGSCPHVLPQWWGAVGDDSTDCHDAIESAITAADTIGRVFIPSGIYQYSTAIDNFPYNYPGQRDVGIEICGSGMEHTVLKYTGASGYGIKLHHTDLETGQGWRTVNFVTIRDLMISAPNATAADSGGLQFLGAERCYIERVGFKDIDTTNGVAIKMEHGVYYVTESGMTTDVNRVFTNAGGATDRYAVAFTTPAAPDNGYVYQITVRLAKTGSPTGTIAAYIYDDSSGPSTELTPASQTVDITTLSSDADGGDVTFTWDWHGRNKLSGSTKTWVVFVPNYGTYNAGVDEIRFRVDNNGGSSVFASYHGGTQVWTVDADDGANYNVYLKARISQFNFFHGITIHDTGAAIPRYGFYISDGSMAFISDSFMTAKTCVYANSGIVKAVNSLFENNDNGRPIHIDMPWSGTTDADGTTAGGRTLWVNCKSENGTTNPYYFSGGFHHVFKGCYLSGKIDWAQGTPIYFDDCMGQYYTTDDPGYIAQDFNHRIYIPASRFWFGETSGADVDFVDADAVSGEAIELDNSVAANQSISIEYTEANEKNGISLPRGVWRVTCYAKMDSTSSQELELSTNYNDGSWNYQLNLFDLTTSYAPYSVMLVVDSDFLANRVQVRFRNKSVSDKLYISHVDFRYVGPDESQHDLMAFSPVSGDTAGARAARVLFGGRRSGDEQLYQAIIKASHMGVGDDNYAELLFQVNRDDDEMEPSDIFKMDGNGEITSYGTMVDHGAVDTMAGDETFDRNDGNIFIKDPGGAGRDLDPSGSFSALTLVVVVNTADAAETISFDSGGLNQVINQNERGIFVYDGSNWFKVYVGS